MAEVVKLTAEQTGGPLLGVKSGLVFEYDMERKPGQEWRRVVCRVSDVERGLGYRYKAGPTAREQASLVLLGLCADLRCLKRG